MMKIFCDDAMNEATTPKNRCDIERVRPFYCLTQDNTKCFFKYVNKVTISIGIPGGYEKEEPYYVTDEELLFRRMSGYFDTYECFNEYSRVFVDF